MDEAQRTPDLLQAPATSVIRTPDQRLRVFVSSTLQELADERAAVRDAITRLHLTPVLFELGARAHPPRTLYRAYLEQSHIFVGIYWQRYGWVAPDMEISGLEDEYRLSGQKPKLIYVKTPSADREARLVAMLDNIKQDSAVSYKPFNSAAELGQLIENDLAVLISEQFEMAQILAVSRGAQGVGGTPRRIDNLPALTTPLVGRERQIDEICELLSRDDTRLVTLHGPGGIGKTRLAVEAGQRLCRRFEDGVCFVALATVDDPKQVAPTIAQALGLRESQGTPVTDGLKLALRDKRLLLVLDNFEQVVDAAPFVADLLEASPRLCVLVTSRSVLHLRGETGYPVPPLALPPSPPAGSPAGAGQSLDQYEAVRFFIERGRAVNARFTATANGLRTIAEICRRLDGLPLAIELAAARIKLLTPEAILARLTRSAAAGEAGTAGSPLQLLSSGARDLPARQRTLRDAIDWSYNLLTAPEQKMFMQLSAFVGGCALDAVEAICDASGGDAIELLSSLVDKSLMRQGISADGEPRFMMLETLREYALERLEADDSAADVRRRHADFYVTLAHQSRTEMRSHRQSEWIDILAREDDNLRAAQRWLIDQGDAVTVAEVGWSIWLYRLVSGTINEGNRWMTEALVFLDAGLPRFTPPFDGQTERHERYRAAARAALQDPNLAPKIAARAHATWIAGGAALWAGTYDRAYALLEEGVALEDLLGNQEGKAIALMALSYACSNRGDFTRASSLSDESRRLFHELGNLWGITWSLNARGRLLTRQGKYDEAWRVYEENLALLRQTGDSFGLSDALADMAWSAAFQGKAAEAAPLIREAADIAWKMGYWDAMTQCLESSARISYQQGEARKAATLLGAADRMRQSAGIPVWSVDLASHQQLLDDSRLSCGEKVFEQAWSEGQTLTVDQLYTIITADHVPGST